MLLLLEAPKFHCDTTALWKKSWGRGSLTPQRPEGQTLKIKTQNKNTNSSCCSGQHCRPRSWRWSSWEWIFFFYLKATGEKKNALIRASCKHELNTHSRLVQRYTNTGNEHTRLYGATYKNQSSHADPCDMFSSDAKTNHPFVKASDSYSHALERLLKGFVANLNIIFF